MATEKINAIIVDVNVNRNKKLAVRIDYAIFGEYELRSRYYTWEGAQRFITRTKLYRFDRLPGHGIWAEDTYTIKDSGEVVGLHALYCYLIDEDYKMDVFFKDGSVYYRKLTMKEAEDLFWISNYHYENSSRDSNREPELR